MNIFILSSSPFISAIMQCDSHVTKMTLESAQMLCTAHRVLDGELIIGKSPTGRKQKQYVLTENNDVIYKAAHVNHPCSIWVRQSDKNYDWLYEHFKSLAEEFTYRYGKEHLCWTKLGQLLATPPRNIPVTNDLTPFAQAMPDEYRDSNAIVAYNNYYRSKMEKMKMVWTKRNTPEWVEYKHAA